MCREAGGGAALHAGGRTVAGTRAWGAWVTDQASRAVAARLCCAYPKDEGRRQELHGPWRERACLLSLSCAKCLGNTRESWMLASRIVAQRVSPAPHFCTRKIKGLRVAYVCRITAACNHLTDGRPQSYGKSGADGPGEHGTRAPEFVRPVPRCADRTPCASQRSLALPCGSGTCGSRRGQRQRCSPRRPATSPARSAPGETGVAGAWTLGRDAPRRALERSD
jgi:hypothetical protein